LKEDVQITVFTPTYNRAYILNRLYESLKRQTCDSFFWLIVDDGSFDNTDSLVNSWINENIIKIRYYRQLNGGKQRAHNRGVELCDTELFICVDSDDYLTDNAIEIFISTWNSLENKENISGIVALRGRDLHNPLGTWMPNNIKLSSLSDLYDKYRFRGDTALLFRSDILKKFPFFVVEEEKFIGEGYVYIQIDQLYSLYLLNKIVYLCEYLGDGYTSNVRKLIKDNPQGYKILNKKKALLSKRVKNKYLNTIRYIIGCILSNDKHPIKNAPYKIFAILSYPPAIILYLLFYRKC